MTDFDKLAKEALRDALRDFGIDAKEWEEKK